MSNIHIEDYEDENTDITNIIARLTKPLWKVQEDAIEYGVTVNVQPTRLINKKQWKLYNHDQQRAILTRMEASIRRNTPSIELVELHFEVCPTLKNIHFHALYKMPRIFVVELETQWNRLVGSIINKDTKEPFRHLDIKEISGGNKEWIKYINKDKLKV